MHLQCSLISPSLHSLTHFLSLSWPLLSSPLPGSTLSLSLSSGTSALSLYFTSPASLYLPTEFPVHPVLFPPVTFLPSSHPLHPSSTLLPQLLPPLYFLSPLQIPSLFHNCQTCHWTYPGKTSFLSVFFANPAWFYPTVALWPSPISLGLTGEQFGFYLGQSVSLKADS